MPKPNGWTRRWLGVATCATALACATGAHAQDRDFEIPEGELKAALEAYVVASGQQILYKLDDLKGQRSKGVQGRLTPEQALERLIEGTTLRIRRDESGAVVLFPGDAANGGAVVGTSDAAESVVTELGTVVITGRSFSHLADRNRTGTRSDTDPLDLAQSVTTVRRQLIEEQQSRGLQDVLRNVAGVDYRPTDAPSGFLMRGMEASVLTNGSLADNTSTRTQRPAIAMQSVEVVRGPESIIGGAQAGYGGVINVITKTADGAPVHEATLRAGPRRLVANGLDLGGAFSTERLLNYRLVAEVERSGDTAVGYQGPWRDYLAPSLGWDRRSSGTSVLLDAVYSRALQAPRERVFTNGPPSDDLVPVAEGPRGSGFRFNERSLTLSASQRLAGIWSLRWKTDAGSDRNRNLSGFGDASAATWPVVSFQVVDQEPSQIRRLEHRAELYGEFDTGPFEHRVIAAYDWSRLRFSAGAVVQVGSFTRNLASGEVIDTSQSSGLPITLIPASRSESRQSGLMLQDQWRWGEWAGLVAARRVRTEDALEGQTLPGLDKWLPTVGLVYRAGPDTSWYVNRAGVFRSNASRRTFTGEGLPPETGVQVEGGVKALLLDKSVAFTASAYRIRQQNVAGPDFVNSNGEFWLLEQDVRSDGGEVEASGSRARWSWRVSLAYNDIRLADRTPLPDRPRLQSSGYLRYAFGDNESRGAWVAADVQYRKGVASQPSSFPGITYPARSSVLLNVGTGYSAEAWSIVTGVRNLLDRRVYTIPSLTIEQPREWSVTGALRF